MTEITRIWKEIDAWLALHWPQGLEDLRPPATPADIEALEAMLGATLPAALAESLQVHNGQGGHFGFLLPSGHLLGTAEIAEHWRCWKSLLDAGQFRGLAAESQSGVLPDWWSTGWVPITHNGFGDHHCLDLSPATAGAVGQVVAIWHDQPERTVVAPSYTAWLRRLLEDLHCGAVVYSAHENGLVEADLLH